jgi:hypothetical protein
VAVKEMETGAQREVALEGVAAALSS